jgi:hypothetical protein
VPIRLCLAALFALGTAVVIVVASVVFVHFLAAGLGSSLDASLRARADSVVPLLDGLAATATSNATANAGHQIAPLRGQGEGLAQVFDASGRLVASSAGPDAVALLDHPDLVRAHRAVVSKTMAVAAGGGNGSSQAGNASVSSAIRSPGRALRG